MALVTRLHPELKACYNKELAVDRDEEGCVVIVVRLAPDGTVASTESTEAEGLSPSLLTCLESIFRSQRFDAPPPDGRSYNVPIKLMVPPRRVPKAQGT